MNKKNNFAKSAPQINFLWYMPKNFIIYLDISFNFTNTNIFGRGPKLGFDPGAIYLSYAIVSEADRTRKSQVLSVHIYVKDEGVFITTRYGAPTSMKETFSMITIYFPSSTRITISLTEEKYISTVVIWKLRSRATFNQCLSKNNIDKTGVINDPLGQTHSLAISEHCFRLTFDLFWKVGTDGRTDGRTDGMCKNNDHYRPWLWVGRVDQKIADIKEIISVSDTVQFSKTFYLNKTMWTCWFESTIFIPKLFQLEPVFLVKIVLHFF